MAQKLAKGISGLVGLGQEAYQHNKEKKAAATAAEPSSAQPRPVCPAPPSYTDVVDREKGETDVTTSSDEEDDEELWLEDDAQTAIQPAKEESRPKIHNAAKWTEAFLRRNPPPPLQQVPLPAPVIIPQRRPGSRTRGFIQAYAPAMADSGIDQKAWLEIMSGFHEQTEQEGYFHVTNIAIALSVMSYTIACGPSVIVHFSALAVHTSIEASRRLYISKKTNSYLDELNAHYFQPRGLYAMIMQYDPSDKQDSQMLDFDSLSANAVAKKTGDGNHNFMSGFKGSSGKTLESQIPGVCPLIFPDLENASEEQQKNGFKKAVGFARDYYDRRERATFAAHNEGSKLNVEDKPFAGKYGDPRNFEGSGIIGVLTGGAVDPMKRRKERRMRRYEETGRGGRGLLGRGRGGSSTGRGRGGNNSGRRSGIIGGVKKVLGEKVVYLMVVNMVSDRLLLQMWIVC